MRVTVRDGSALEVRVAGAGPTIVFHPGFSMTADCWDGVVGRLVEDFRCVTFDPRGHGRSDKPWSDYTIEELALDLLEIMSHLKLRDVTLVGHSMGGAVAVAAISAVGQTAPVTRLVLSSPGVPSVVERPGFRGMKPAEHANLATTIATDWPGMVADFPPHIYHAHAHDSPVVAWLCDRQLEFPAYLAARLWSNLGAVNIPRETLASINVPTLVIGAKCDRLLPIEAVDWFRSNGPKDWQITILDEAGHCSMVDAPEQYAAVLRAFAASQKTDSRSTVSP